MSLIPYIRRNENAVLPVKLLEQQHVFVGVGNYAPFAEGGNFVVERYEFCVFGPDFRLRVPVHRLISEEVDWVGVSDFLRAVQECSAVEQGGDYKG